MWSSQTSMKKCLPADAIWRGCCKWLSARFHGEEESHSSGPLGQSPNRGLREQVSFSRVYIFLMDMGLTEDSANRKGLAGFCNCPEEHNTFVI